MIKSGSAWQSEADAHGGCPQLQGYGDAIVPELARRNLVTLVGATA